MKKSVRAFTILLLLFVVVLSGCSDKSDKGGKKETDQNAGKGRYVEETVAFPENLKSVFSMKKLEDGSLLLTADTKEDALVVFTSIDEGKSWIKSDRIKASLIPKGNRVVSATADSKGKLYIAYAKPMDKDQLSSITSFTGDIAYCTIDSKGNQKELKLKLPKFEKEDNFAVGLNHLDMNEKGSLFGSADGKIYQLDAESGELQKTYSSQGSDQFFAIWDKLIIIRGDKIEQYALDGTKLENLDILKDYIGIKGDAGVYSMINEGSKENEIYFCNKDGVFRYTFGGNIVEQLVDGSLSSLGAANISYLALIQKKDGNFQILYDDYSNKKFTLVDYAYNAEIPSLPTDELRVYSLRESDTIQNMITAFQKENSNIHVIYETGISGDNAVSESDAIKTLNTEMLAGTGPDILALDHLPVDSYMEKGMLYDMSKLFKSIEEKNQLYTNVVEAYKLKGKLYATPIRFKIPLLAGNKTTADKVTDMESMALTAQSFVSENPKGNYLYVDFEDVLFQKLFSVYYKNCFKEDGSIQEENLKAFLSNFKIVFDAAIKNKSKSEMNGFKLKREVSEKAYPTMDFQDVYENIFFNTSGIKEGSTALSIGMLSDAKTFSDLIYIRDDQSDYLGKLLNSETAYFKPMSAVGINSKSKNAENAKKFIEFLYTEKAQEIECYNGFPVSKTVFLKNEEEPSAETMAEFNMGSSTPYKWASKSEFEELNHMVETLEAPCYTNRIVADMIYKNAEKYFEGKDTIEQAMELVKQKLNLYLSE